MQVEVVSNTEPVSTLLAGETLKMVNIGSGSHHHLKGGNHLKREVYCDLLFNLIMFFYLSTSSTVAGRAKESEVVALAQQKVSLRVQRLTHLKHKMTSPTVAKYTFCNFFLANSGI